MPVLVPEFVLALEPESLERLGPRERSLSLLRLLVSPPLRRPQPRPLELVELELELLELELLPLELLLRLPLLRPSLPRLLLPLLRLLLPLLLLLLLLRPSPPRRPCALTITADKSTPHTINNGTITEVSNLLTILSGVMFSLL
ncbi:MAG: hypothetical protein DMF71_04730 [Acidobacteria bacterium]|nr:MAG: hypothetical protein DMF71_04730 [Acidobacteriota bacterium]